MSSKGAYYNENEPYVVEWLRNLILCGLIADGEVDDRSIVDVRPDDLAGFAQCHFFAGIGGWSLALRLARWSDDRPVWTGSCPCQPFSNAGKRGGIADDRHLWPEWFRLIRECRPATIFGEQVASKDGLGWLDIVQADLESTDYAVGAADLCAAGVEAPHIRQRLWFVADTNSAGLARFGTFSNGTDRINRGRILSASSWWSVESGVDCVAHGVSARVAKLRALGNAIVPQVAAEFIAAAMECRP